MKLNVIQAPTNTRAIYVNLEFGTWEIGPLVIGFSVAIGSDYRNGIREIFTLTTSTVFWSNEWEEPDGLIFDDGRIEYRGRTFKDREAFDAHLDMLFELTDED